MRMNLIAQRSSRVVRNQTGVLHLQRPEDARGDDIAPGPAFELFDDLSQQREREVGVVESEVDGQHLLSLFQLAQQSLLVRRVEVLPDPADRLTLQAGSMREQLADGHGTVFGVGQVRVQTVIQRQPAGIAQRHDQHRSERLGDRPDHVLRVVGRPSGRVEPRRTNVQGPHERAVPDDSRAHRRRVPLTLCLAHLALEVANQPVSQRHVAGRDPYSRDR